MQRTIFETIKAEVTTRKAAEFFGMKVNRAGMVSCPFHQDKTPSMKVDRRYHCFSCGADGDVIDFVSQVEGCGKYEAALRLSGYFGISFSEDRKASNERRRKQLRKKAELKAESIANAAFYKALTDYVHDLEDIKSHGKADTPEYLEAVSRLPLLEYVADLYLLAIWDRDRAKQTEIRKRYAKALLKGRREEEWTA